MKIERLTTLFLGAQKFLSKELAEAYQNFFNKEVLDLLSKNLINIYTEGVSKKLKAPLFNEELTPLLDDSFVFFEAFLKKVEVEKNTSIENIEKEIASILEQIDFKHVLLLLGQRITSATVQNSDGIPPLQKDVLEASFKPYNNQVSKAVRAFEKHTQRSENNFWGTISGSPSEKEIKVKAILTKMLEDKTWWNVFYHYKHELIYEIRIPSGHGARWKKSNLEFIGFVEPFIN